MSGSSPSTFRAALLSKPLTVVNLIPQIAVAAGGGGFDKAIDTTNNVVAILVAISIAIVTISIMWAGFKMVCQHARFSDVSNILIGGTMIGAAPAAAAYIVN